MNDFAPPTGPPPPKVPAGWRAQWNDQYSEWFYVNIYNKKSQWDKPTEAVYGPESDTPPSGPPPSYDQGSSRPVAPEKSGHLHTNNPYGASSAGSRPLSSHGMTDDEALARKLQAEENARVRGTEGPGGPGEKGLSDDYYSGNSASPFGNSYGNQQPGSSSTPNADLPTRPPEKRGAFSKLFGKSPNKPQQQSQYPQGQGYPQQGSGYGSQGPSQGPPQGPPQGQGYGGGYGGPPPQQGYGGGYGGPPPPQQGYSGYGGPPPPQAYYGQPGYAPPQQPVYYQQAPPQQQQPQQKHGIGVGTAALGIGGALVGGMLLEDAIDGGDHGGDDGGDWGGDDGGDWGGDF